MGEGFWLAILLGLIVFILGYAIPWAWGDQPWGWLP